MFADYVYEKSSAEFSDRVILIDSDDLERKTKYSEYFAAHGFQIIRYQDDLHLRLEHEDAVSGENGKYVLLVEHNSYVPYDVLKRYRRYAVSLANLFPKLNAAAIKDTPQMDYDLLSIAYSRNFSDLRSENATKQFVEGTVYSRSNIEKYLSEKNIEMHKAASEAVNYKGWCHVANLKALIDSTAAGFDIEIQTDDVHKRFVEFILANFGKLSSAIDKNGPVLVSRAMEYMHDHSDKFAIVVMDGMSEFDWHIISQSFEGIRYEKADTFAMIPTTTSISRQCLLSNKYPSQLQEPWKQSKEKNEFIECAKDLGYSSEQIGYERGYDADFGAFVKCAAVIINDVDDMVHAQMQGRIGMFNDISVLAKQGQLALLVKRLLKKGFDVYISADHGNTPCTGMGKLMKTGVEVETKSRRMIVLKDFADKQKLIDQYELIDYPKYYLSKEFDYLICGIGCSFDARGDEVMSHGGITIDEVIVPFIKIKAVENNG